MKTENIIYYLKTLYRALNIPITYGDKKSTQHFQPFELITGENELEYIFKRLQRVFTKFPKEHAMYFVDSSMVMLGIVANHDSGEFVFVGPLAPASATEQEIADYLFQAGLSADTTRKMSNYMNSMKSWSLSTLKELLVNINVILNDEIISTKELAVIYDSETENKITFAEKKFNTEATQQEQQNTMLVEEYTTKLNYCVMNGDLDGLSDLLNNLGTVPYPENTYDPNLKDLKMIAFGSVFATEAVAMKSGIPAADLDRTKQYYLTRIDNSKSPDDIQQCTVSSLFEFTKLVKEYLADKTENPSIYRAINYIKTNINSKLLIEDIAKALNINLHYLFTRFKSETGKTLTQYINEEKIKKACYYLLFTDKSMVEIASYLSFSSQSYFITVFKKVMGQTPAEWREKNTYVK